MTAAGKRAAALPNQRDNISAGFAAIKNDLIHFLFFLSQPGPVPAVSAPQGNGSRQSGRLKQVSSVWDLMICLYYKPVLDKLQEKMQIIINFHFLDVPSETDHSAAASRRPSGRPDSPESRRIRRKRADGQCFPAFQKTALHGGSGTFSHFEFDKSNNFHV
jgi:hypothetical protein